MNWKERIIYQPDICHGIPCVKDTRIQVSLILDNLALGKTYEEIIENYPSITDKDIKACLLYAAELSKERNIAI